MNWEEEGSLNCLSKEVMDAIFEDVTERRRQRAALVPPPFSPEEKAFFESYEKQLG